MPEDLPESSSRTGMHSVGDYYSAVQLRSDRWSALREVVDGLSHLGPGDAGAGTLARRAEELFEALSPIEMYWAFPGLAAFDHMRRQLDHRNWEDLAFSVRRVVRALTSGAYRRRTIPLARGDNAVACRSKNRARDDSAPHPHRERRAPGALCEATHDGKGRSACLQMSRHRLRTLRERRPPVRP